MQNSLLHSKKLKLYEKRLSGVSNTSVFKISQNLQKTPILESLCSGLNLCNIVEAPACIFIKKETPAQMLFCDFCKSFKSAFFIELLRVTTSGSSGRYLKMTSIEAIVTLMPTLNIFWSAAITLKLPSRITSKNLRHFQEKYMWWGSVIVKQFSLGFTVILLMTEAVVRRCCSKQVFLKTGLQKKFKKSF